MNPCAAAWLPALAGPRHLQRHCPQAPLLNASRWAGCLLSPPPPAAGAWCRHLLLPHAAPAVYCCLQRLAQVVAAASAAAASCRLQHAAWSAGCAAAVPTAACPAAAAPLPRPQGCAAPPLLHPGLLPPGRPASSCASEHRGREEGTEHGMVAASARPGPAAGSTLCTAGLAGRTCMQVANARKDVGRHGAMSGKMGMQLREPSSAHAPTLPYTQPAHSPQRRPSEKGGSAASRATCSEGTPGTSGSWAAGPRPAGLAPAPAARCRRGDGTCCAAAPPAALLVAWRLGS